MKTLQKGVQIAISSKQHRAKNSFSSILALAASLMGPSLASCQLDRSGTNPFVEPDRGAQADASLPSKPPSMQPSLKDSGAPEGMPVLPPQKADAHMEADVHAAIDAEMQKPDVGTVVHDVAPIVPDATLAIPDAISPDLAQAKDSTPAMDAESSIIIRERGGTACVPSSGCGNNLNRNWANLDEGESYSQGDITFTAKRIGVLVGAPQGRNCPVSNPFVEVELTFQEGKVPYPVLAEDQCLIDNARCISIAVGQIDINLANAVGGTCAVTGKDAWLRITTK